METAALIEILDREGRLLAAAAAAAGVDAPVPTCPGWRVRDLLEHLGGVHLWATRFVAEGLAERVPAPAAPELDEAGLVAWYRECHRALVDTLTAADPEVKCFTFLPAPSPLEFWARRQAHETAVHRVDAEAARGGDFSRCTPEFAADGVDELLIGFHSLARSRVRTEVPRTLRVSASDRDAVWTIRLSEDVPRIERGGEGAADCELGGPAHDLYLALWNRLPITALSVAGDAELATLWRERSGI
ncbi:maleylpyruvate isomerase family mycothiol-dependent enzyme [Streptomyces sp. NPDC044780]|uniref:maleylpyruvate isomerase family mycothiol-dependent enzyme n=1 Tax=unclassified Streptomyces TaxID=2593676 RepID=UPI0034108870